MKKIFALIALIISFSSLAARDLPTADYVDVERYIGKWYAVTSLPQIFTLSCKAQTAEYGIINPQTISVKNTCIKRRGEKVIEGQGVVKNAATNAELEVTFNNFFTRLFRIKGDYTIIRLDPDYRYVMVGSHDRRSLWILSRTKDMPETELNLYVEEAKSLGFPVRKLKPSKWE